MRVAAYAKLNLGLRILGRRADGYHELRTIFQTISLADEVEITFGAGRGVRFALELPPARAELARWFEVPGDETNLAARAAALAREEFRLRGQIRVRLRKCIPAGAGLGGGSADAAATLRGLAARARPAPPPEVLWRLAAALGADVAALLIGGTVLGVGRGDECYPLPPLPPLHAVVALPAQPVATAQAYARWDALHPEAAGAASLTGAEASARIYSFCGSLMRALPASRRERDRGRAERPIVRAGIENDFEEVVGSLSPDFAKIRAALRRAGAGAVALTGSGAAQYGLFATRAAAAVARARLAALGPAWMARFVGRRG
ncbi:MAG TPA: hypothetical protein VE996_11610 [Terriglobales bacterium]|nr:hypothetical protein [Terriglobales bacterium]